MNKGVVGCISGIFLYKLPVTCSKDIVKKASSIYFIEICFEAGLPPGVLNIIH